MKLEFRSFDKMDEMAYQGAEGEDPLICRDAPAEGTWGSEEEKWGEFGEFFETKKEGCVDVIIDDFGVAVIATGKTENDTWSSVELTNHVRRRVGKELVKEFKVPMTQDDLLSLGFQINHVG